MYLDLSGLYDLKEFTKYIKLLKLSWNIITYDIFL